jgi:hypothetical protein
MSFLLRTPYPVTYLRLLGSRMADSKPQISQQYNEIGNIRESKSFSKSLQGLFKPIVFFKLARQTCRTKIIMACIKYLDHVISSKDTLSRDILKATWKSNVWIRNIISCINRLGFFFLNEIMPTTSLIWRYSIYMYLISK